MESGQRRTPCPSPPGQPGEYPLRTVGGCAMIRPLSMGPAFDQFAVSIDYDGLGLTVARFPTPMEAARALVWLRAVQERVGG